MRVYALAAMNDCRVIGMKGKIPWEVPQDVARVRELTIGHLVLMGRLTYESIPERFRPLPDRKNIIVTSQEKKWYPEEVEVWRDPLQCVRHYQKLVDERILWVLGGGTVYEQLLPFCEELFLTVIKGNQEGDTFFPRFEDSFTEQESIPFQFGQFLRYRRKGREERYLHNDL